MTGAVVGIFDAYDEAQSTVNELISAGFEKQEISLNEGNALLPEDFPHGNYVVTAVAETDIKSEIASSVMGHHHPVEVDQRSDEWISSEAAKSHPDRYRAHWEENYRKLGGRYEDYVPAYELGAHANASEIYQGRTWEQAETELRSSWQMRHPGSEWEHFKESVRHGFNRGRH